MGFLRISNEVILKYGPKLISFLAVLLIGWGITKYIVKLIEKALIKSRLDVSVHGFMLTISGFFLKLIVLITAATIIGVPVTTFIAMLSAAGLAVGLALKDSLSNFAAGILLLTFRPFSVGDFIETDSFSGTVLSVQVLYTALNTMDNKRVMVPNGSLATSHIINYSIEPFRRIDKVYSVAYGSDVIKVKEVLMGIIIRNENIIEDRGVLLGVSNHNDNSIDFDLKFWVKREDFLTVSYSVNEEVIQEFEKNGIRIPYPTRDINLTLHKENKDDDDDVLHIG